MSSTPAGKAGEYSIPASAEFILLQAGFISSAGTVSDRCVCFSQADCATFRGAAGKIKLKQGDNRMKNMKTIASATALGLAACSFAIAQGRPGGAQQPPKDAAAAVAHIAEVYPKIAPFDVNADGQLDRDERLALGQAMAEGKVEGPTNRNPEVDEAAHPGIIIQRIASLYGIAFSFDKDEDDMLNEAEQAALKGAIEKGEVKRPGMGGGPPPGVGGRPF
jgi:hypothetical protein